MNPIEPSSSSHPNPFPLQSFTKAHIESALNYLKEHKELRSALSKEDFEMLRARSSTALFQEALDLSPKVTSILQSITCFLGFNTCSYDQILELRLDAWAMLSENNQSAKERILRFLQDSSQNELDLSSLSLTSLPDIWEHSAFITRLQTLDLSRNKLASLPSSIGNLVNLQTLNLSRNELTSLPDWIGNLVNLQTLDLSYNNLILLPGSIGNLLQLRTLRLYDNLSLTSLPEEIFQLPHNCLIDLENCGLSAHVVTQALAHMDMRHTGPHITFSIREASTSSKSTNELLSELFKAAEMDPFPLPAKWDHDQSLQSWLNRLSSMADYNAGRGAKRKALANKVLSFLKFAINDPAFKGVFFPVIQEATTTCGDRMALSILYLGIAYKLSTADKKDLKSLATLLTRGSLALEWLEEVASNKVQSLFGCDPIEVYLGYPVMLKEELKLPIDVEEMLYFRCSSLKKEDLEAAKQIVLARFADKEVVYKKLCQRDLWINALKENYPEETKTIEEKKQKLLEEQNYDLKEVEEAWIALTKKALSPWTP